MPVSSLTKVSDIIERAMQEFEIVGEDPEDYRLVEVILDKGGKSSFHLLHNVCFLHTLPNSGVTRQSAARGGLLQCRPLLSTKFVKLPPPARQIFTSKKNRFYSKKCALKSGLPPLKSSFCRLGWTAPR